MKGRPAKRQKRHVVQSSDNDDDSQQASDPDTNHGSNQHQRSQTGSPATKKQLPARGTRTSAGSKSAAKGDSGLKQINISSFYKKTPNGAPAILKVPSPTKQERKNSVEIEDDLIQDDDQDIFDLLAEHHSQKSAASVAATSSRPASTQHPTQLPKQKLPVRRLHALGATTTPTSTKDYSTSTEELPWIQRWPPRMLEELGVHKKKVQDVRGWLERALHGDKYKRLLVLRGPPGSGKTATVETLGKALDFDISEWSNVQDMMSSTGEYTSLVASFEEFLGRGERYGSLRLANGSSVSRPSDGANGKVSSSRKILLLEEFPSSLFGGGSAIASFRDVLSRFIAIQPTSSFGGLSTSAQSTSASLHPLVIIVSESAAISSGEGAEAFSAHKLLGPDLLTHPAVATIDFNPVAPTLLLKVLEQTLKKAAPTGRERRAFATSHLRALSDSGDMRAAIAALEFLFVAQQAGQTQTSISAALAAGGIGQQRDSALELFHAVGKVLYNKRCAPSAADSPDARVSDFDVQHVIEETGRDAGIFVAALHENYVPSCEPTSEGSGDGDDDESDFLAHADACISVLSDADLLSTDAASESRAAASGASLSSGRGNASVDALRQSAMSTGVAVRGLLVALPYPVKRRPMRAAAGGAGTRDVHKMFYPESTRVRARATEMAGFATAALKAYRELQGVGASMGGELREFELETASYLARIKGSAAQNARALQTFIAFDTMDSSASGAKTAQTAGRGNVLGKRVAGAETVAKSAAADLSASLTERLYLSDDDIED